MTFPVPAGVDWLVHRIATGKYYKDSLADMYEHWTFRDLVDAHLTTDALERAEAEAQCQS